IESQTTKTPLLSCGRSARTRLRRSGIFVKRWRNILPDTYPVRCPRIRAELHRRTASRQSSYIQVACDSLGSYLGRGVIRLPGEFFCRVCRRELVDRHPIQARSANCVAELVEVNWLLNVAVYS